MTGESLAEAIEKVVAERNKLQKQVHHAETALMLIRETTTDAKTRGYAEAALETLPEVR